MYPMYTNEVYAAAQPILIMLESCVCTSAWNRRKYFALDKKHTWRYAMLIVGGTEGHRGDQNGGITEQGLSLWCVRLLIAVCTRKVPEV